MAGRRATASGPPALLTSPSASRMPTVGARGIDDGEDAADEFEEFLLNLTVDGVREGAYMVCKHADDLLGHHARQAFRDKAASMRAENSIYYYLKELMKKFGSQQHAPKRKSGDNEPVALVLEAHEFRKLIASDPAFESAIPSDQVDALFYRMVEQDGPQKLIRHQDFLEFCLLDQDQLRVLLFKYRRHIKKLRLTDNEVADTFKRLATVGSVEMSPELLHASIRRDMDVVLTTGEIAFMMQLMDGDSDGVVKVNDFEAFLKDDRASVELLHPLRDSGVADIRISASDADESNLKRDGYTQLHPSLHESSRMYIWYRSIGKDEGRAALASVKYASSSRDTELVAKGFTCLQQDINRQGAFGKHKYLWMSFVGPNNHLGGDVIDLSLTCGSLSDLHDAKLWMPRHRGFKLVPGNLNEKSLKNAVFLWVRRRLARFKEDLVDHQASLTVESPRLRPVLSAHIDELERQVRKTLRRNCPIDQDCSLNFVRLFDEFDPKKTRGISRQAALIGIETFGIKMDKKDFALFWDRMNPSGAKHIDVNAFSDFLELTDAEIDEMLSTLQRGFTARMSHQVPNYRLIFQSYNSLGDGRLSRSDFQRIFATNQLNFTNNELGKVIQRFDVNRDGVVDYTDFLKYITGECDASSRAATRIADAAEEIRAWAIERQSKKLAKEGNIDSTGAWKLLKPKRGLIDANSVDHVLRQRKFRLDSKSLQLLMVLMAPATNGSVTQAAFHSFVNHLPKKIGVMVYEFKKLIGPALGDGDVDHVFNRLNLESNGKLPIVKFSQQVNALAVENGANTVDLKDLAYLIQWAGAYCAGDGTVLIDRFLAGVRENRERRNMKSEFVTHYDSPKFLEGVSLLREEFKRCAKTPDGKYNYLIPFRLFDKDNSGQIALSEFEAGIRELGVDSYLSDQEVKGLMRRFDPNSSGAIDYHEFLRFNLAESSSSSRRLTLANTADMSVQSVIEEIIVGERLTSANITVYCASLKRMFSIIDKDSTGTIPCVRFSEVMKEMGISLPKSDLDALLHGFCGGEDDDEIHYLSFCEALVLECERHQDDQNRLGLPPSELLELLKELFQGYNTAQQRAKSAGRDAFNLYETLRITKDAPDCITLSAEDFKEVLWAAGVRHPYLRDELESIMSCFQTHTNSAFNIRLFNGFLSKGTRALVEVTDGALDVYLLRFQEELRAFLSTGRDAGDRLFAMFTELDANGNGTISHDEFLNVLEKVGLDHFLPPDDERLLMSFLDTNGDGTISYQELLDFAKHAGEKLNAAAAQIPAPPSPGPPSPSPSPPKPELAVQIPESPPAQPSSKPVASATISSIVLPREHLQVMYHIWKLNKKLTPAFPFRKYFEKYRVKTDEPRVKTRVFEKVIDKFLGRLMERHVTYNMKQIDVETLIAIFATQTGGDTINYENFLNALAQSQSLADTSFDTDGSCLSSCGSDDDDDALSCSSDEGDRLSERKTKALRGALANAIRREYSSSKELQALKAHIVTLQKEFGQHTMITEHKMFKTLVTLGLRLGSREAKILLSAVAVTEHGKEKFDVRKLSQMIQDQVEIELGKESQASAAENAKRSSPSAVESKGLTKLRGLVADKVSRCFVSAAQNNISGRKLLEKCDPKGTGKITLLEFQTVLRLMGCTLTEGEMDEVKKALGDSSSALINYGLLVNNLTTDSGGRPPQGNKLAASSPDKLQLQRPLSIQMPPAPTPLLHTGEDFSHQGSRVEFTKPDAAVYRRPMSAEEVKQVDSFVCKYFSELIHTRSISSDDMLQLFEGYDRKGSGFTSIDAFKAVMRRCDIFLPSDISGTVIQRFTAVSPEKFDYVDFCQTINSWPDAAAGVRPPSSPLRHSLLPVHSSPQTAARTAPSGPYSSKSREDGSAYRSSRSERQISTLPSLDFDHKATESRSARPAAEPSRSSGNSATAAGWTCPVCFHKQTQPTTYCEICAAQDPSSVESRALVQCLACGFRNRLGTITCDLCTSDLGPSSARSEPEFPTKASAAVGPSTTTVTYDEGWIS